jgi:hypothetical protein
MGNEKGHKKNETRSRRSFFSTLFQGSNPSTKDTGEKVKMLTADGKLVEVDKSALAGARKMKATNKDIFDWMQNPSKEKS